MFQKIDLAYLNSSLAVDCEANEYDCICSVKSDFLLLQALIKQLKVETIINGYALVENKLIYLSEINSNIEYLDNSIRFDLKKINVLNYKDAYLVNRLLNFLNKTVHDMENGIIFGKRNRLIFNSSGLFILKKLKSEYNLLNQLMEGLSDNEIDILNKRFDILLNLTFLNKLKTFYLFWTQKYDLNQTIPVWYIQLTEKNK